MGRPGAWCTPGVRVGTAADSRRVCRRARAPRALARSLGARRAPARCSRPYAGVATPGAEHLLADRADARDRLLERREVDRLDEVLREAGRDRARVIGRLAVPAERDQAERRVGG